MRRPLCLVCMAFVAAVFIMLHIQPMQEHALSEEQEGQVVTRQGIVTAKEYKDGNLILYLEDKDKEGFLVLHVRCNRTEAWQCGNSPGESNEFQTGQKSRRL